MKLCRFDFKTSDGCCVLDGKPCEEDCNSIVEIDESPRTVKSVLLERWAKDTEAMAGNIVYQDHEGNRECYWYHDMEGLWSVTYDYDTAIRKEIAYLNSAAGVQR